MKSKIICLAITSSLLVACGGGGGSNDSNKDQVKTSTESIGVFLDSPVQGLYYETPTYSGLTNAYGEFSYTEGETVSFYLGNTKLGVAQGADIVTPFSLFSMDAPTRESVISTMLKQSEISSYDQAINIAALLQTLDQDANPENGIDLGSAHSDLSNISVDLSVKATAFINEPSLAAAKAILGINTSKKLNQVAAHLYQSLNLSIKSDLVDKVSEALNTRQTITTSLEYDDNKNVIKRHIDTNNDGVTDTTTTFNYDAVGNLTASSNSAMNTSETLSYDANNNLVSLITNNVRRPATEQIFNFNEDKTLSSFEVIDDADRNIKSKISYQYDTQGKLKAYEVDQDNDGNADAQASFVYENDKLSSYSEDRDNSGDPDMSISYQYDSLGKRIKQEVSATLNGMPSSTGTFEYDANGNVILYQQDNDQDGRADYIESSVYNAGNKRITFRKDLDADGAWDSVTEYTYDVDGNRTSMQEDSNGDGIIDKQWSSNYDTKTLDNGWDVIMEKLGKEV